MKIKILKLFPVFYIAYLLASGVACHDLNETLLKLKKRSAYDDEKIFIERIQLNQNIAGNQWNKNCFFLLPNNKVEKIFSILVCFTFKVFFHQEVYESHRDNLDMFSKIKKIYTAYIKKEEMSKKINSIHYDETPDFDIFAKDLINKHNFKFIILKKSDYKNQDEILNHQKIEFINEVKSLSDVPDSYIPKVTREEISKNKRNYKFFISKELTITFLLGKLTFSFFIYIEENLNQENSIHLDYEFNVKDQLYEKINSSPKITRKIYYKSDNNNEFFIRTLNIFDIFIEGFEKAKHKYAYFMEDLSRLIRFPSYSEKKILGKIFKKVYGIEIEYSIVWLSGIDDQIIKEKNMQVFTDNEYKKYLGIDYFKYDNEEKENIEPKPKENELVIKFFIELLVFFVVGVIAYLDIIFFLKKKN